MMRRICADHTSILFVGLLLLFALAPLQAAAHEGLYQDSNQVARKFDEFGRVYGCDYGARLDNFAIQLMEEPLADGYIIAYGPAGDGSGTGNFVLEVAKDYIVNTRGLSPERIKTINAGRYKEWNQTATQLWIAPPGASAPEPVSYNTEVADFTGLFTEYDAWDNIAGGDGGTGPGHGNVPLASFADMLHQRRDTRAFIVVYNMKDATPGAWRRIAGGISNNLQNGYKLEADRVTIIYGGYREPAKKEEAEEAETEAPVFVQFWILPKDAPPPVAESKEPEPRPSKAVLINSSDSYTLSYESEARSAFEGFADVLKNDEQLSACLIVRLGNDVEANVEADKTQPPVMTPNETVGENQLPEADLMALVAKWKADLVKDYGISEHRLIVTIAMTAERGQQSVETWIVPRGAALPDPNARDEHANDVEAAEFEETTQKEF
jgi:hypothetical protein